MHLEYLALFMKSTGKQIYATVDGHRTMTFITKPSNVMSNCPQDGPLPCSVINSPLVWQIPPCPHFCPLVAS